MISSHPTVKSSLSTNTDIISPRLYQNNSPPGFTEHQPSGGSSKKVKLLLALPFHFQQSHNSLHSSPNIWKFSCVAERDIWSVLSSLWQCHDIIMTSCHRDICHDSWHKSLMSQYFCTNAGLSLVSQTQSWPLIGREVTGSVCWPKGGRWG